MEKKIPKICITESAMKLKDAPWKKSYDQPRQHIKKQRHYFANKGPSSQSYGFSNGHVWMWKLYHKESWVLKNWCIWKDPDVGKDWRWEEKGTTEDEMARWHHWLDGHEFEWTPGVGDGQGGLVCCDSWGLKESDTTEQLNWTENTHYYYIYFIIY